MFTLKIRAPVIMGNCGGSLIQYGYNLHTKLIPGCIIACRLMWRKRTGPFSNSPNRRAFSSSTRIQWCSIWKLFNSAFRIFNLFLPGNFFFFCTVFFRPPFTQHLASELPCSIMVQIFYPTMEIFTSNFYVTLVYKYFSPREIFPH